MHQLRFARLPALVTLVAAALLTPLSPGPAVAQAQGEVDVLYAGSLVTPMEGPVKAELARQGVALRGEPGGSKKLANFILAGVRTPDVFVCVDPALIASLGTRVLRATTFATTSLGVAWTPQSRIASQLDAVASGKASLEAVLSAPGLRIGRTDPRIDPKGRYTVQAVTAWLGAPAAQQLLGLDDNPAQIFPEEDLLARLDTGEIDVGFFYRTEAVARGYRFLPLPGNAGMAGRIAYALAVMSGAPHPAQAAAFERFVLGPAGRALFERAGLTYERPVR